MKTEKFTIKDLFPDMDLDQRAALGRKVRAKYSLYFCGELPELTTEYHYGKESQVCLYPKQKNAFDWIGQVKEMAKEFKQLAK